MTHLHKSTVLLIGLLVFGTTSARAEVQVAEVIHGNVVLQRDRPVPIWGIADTGEQVTVEFAGHERTTEADAFGRWRVEFDAMPASLEPRDLTINGSATARPLVVPNVRLGDVWLKIANRTSMVSLPGIEEQVKRDAAGDMPTFSVRNVWNAAEAKRPKETFTNDLRWRYWEPYVPVVNKYFTSSGYVWARDWWDHGLRVPLGFYRVEPGQLMDMTPPSGFATVPPLKAVAQQVAPWNPNSPEGRKAFDGKLAEIAVWSQQMHAKLDDESTTFRNVTQPPAMPGPKAERGQPTTRYNDAIHPLVGARIRGVVIYIPTIGLGDEQYVAKMTALINGLRIVFRDPNLPVCLLQAPRPHSYELREKSEDVVTNLRDRQASLAAIKDVSVIGTYDIDRNRNNRDPSDWSRRIAQWSRLQVAGRVVTSPKYISHRVEADHIVVKVDETLVVGDGKPGTPAGGFVTAGADKIWHPAVATVKGDTIVATSDAVPVPVAVRYAYENVPKSANLYNDEGMPLLPFRTDEW
jgi:sialate O-acetylesterase